MAEVGIRALCQQRKLSAVHSPHGIQRPIKHCVTGGQRSRQAKNSPESAPVCLQDMSICQDVRVEDMGHKQGCNGVDNGKLWFNRELLHAAMALSASLDGPAAAKLLPGCSGAEKLGHVQLIDVRCGGASTCICVHCVRLQPLHWLQSSAPFWLNDWLRCRCEDSQDSPAQRLVKR